MKTILNGIFVLIANFLRVIVFKLDTRMRLHNSSEKGERPIKKYVRGLLRYNPPNQISKKFFSQRLEKLEEILKKYFREQKISESCLRSLSRKLQAKMKKLA